MNHVSSRKIGKRLTALLLALVFSTTLLASSAFAAGGFLSGLFGGNQSQSQATSSQGTSEYRPMAQEPAEQPAPTTRTVTTTNEQKTVNLSEIDRNFYAGKKLGRITCARTGVDCDIVYGTDEDTLWKGAGLHTNSSLPGMATPALLCGHARVCFKGFADAKKGDIITLKMTYGTYKYRINQIKIYNHNKYDFSDLGQINDQLIIYACYPFPKTPYEKTDRIFYYCDRLSGPKIIDDSVGGTHKWAVRPASKNLRSFYTYYKF